MLLARRNANLARSASVNSLLADPGEYRVGLFTASQPRQRMRADEVRFRPGSGSDRRFRESVGESQICQPDRAVRRPHQEVDVGREIGVEAQCGAADDDSDVVAVIRCGQFADDQSAQPPQLGRCRTPAAYLTVERMRHADLYTAVDGFKCDEAADVGLLDRSRISDPPQRGQFDGLPNGQCVDDITHRSW